MIVQKYANDSIVYNFYFNYETGKLLFKELIVSGYDYMDGCQWSVVDEYKLVEEYYVKKYIFFTKRQFHIHRIAGHLISDNIEYARIKFLYHFLKVFNFKPSLNISKPLLKLHNIAFKMYNEIMESNPEMILQAVEDRLASETRMDSYWKHNE